MERVVVEGEMVPALVVSIFVALIIILVGFVASDTPCNCVSDQVLGQWKLIYSDMEMTREGDSVDCSSWFLTHSMLVELSEPNVVTTDKGTVGTWVMHSNQGFEIKIDGLSFFHFLGWREEEDGSITSICSSNEPNLAWYHEDVVDPQMWGCYVAKMIKPLNQGQQTQTTEASVNLQDDATIEAHPHGDLVDYLNQLYVDGESLFRAKKYDRWADPDNTWRKKKTGKHVSKSLREGKTMDSEEQGPRYVPGSPKHHSHLPYPYNLTRNVKDLPASWDWRNVDGRNYVPAPRDQASCGSCFAFASTGALMSRIRIDTELEEQPDLSVQQIVSCSDYSQGCDGGLPELAGKFMVDFGIVEESVFPYTATVVECEYDRDAPRYWAHDPNFLGGYYGATQLSPEAMMQELVESGPMSVSVYCQDDFSAYEGGIYYHQESSEDLEFYEPTNHAILLVGYGEEDGVPYWIVQNSWGDSWGEEGYIRILRGTDESAIESKPIVLYYEDKHPREN